MDLDVLGGVRNRFPRMVDEDFVDFGEVKDAFFLAWSSGLIAFSK